MAKGLLMAMMEPPAGFEEEFHDWYDTEHVPERMAVKGFETGQRFVCVSGFPKYVALYDLTTIDVLKSPEYAEAAGDGVSPWTHRVRTKMKGRYRFTGVQVYPGDSLLGQGGPGTRPVLLRFRQAPETEEPMILRGLRRNFDDRAGVCQVRLFKGNAKKGTDYIATVECHANITESRVKPELFGAALRYMDMENVYTAYWRTTKA